MSVQLLDKTRKINKLLHNNNSSKVVFNDICAVLTEILDSNVLVVSRKGKILGVSKCPQVREIHELITEAVGSHIDPMLNERLLSILSTKENVNLETLGFSADAVGGCEAIITPIDIAGERLGTLFIYKQDATYSIDDIILSEYGTAVVGLEMLRSVNEESAEETRKEHIVQSAISTLSFSELEAIIHILMNLAARRESSWPARLRQSRHYPFGDRQRAPQIRERRCDRVPFFRYERNLYQSSE